METTMTIAIVTAQGHGYAGRRKTCARASTEGEVATWRMTAHEFVSLRPPSGRAAKEPPNPVRNRDVRDDRYGCPDLHSLAW
jgi:hypothetical protein